MVRPDEGVASTFTGRLACSVCPKSVTLLPTMPRTVKQFDNSVTHMEMNAAQCRMARAALQLGVREVATLAQVSPNTVARLERGEKLLPRTVSIICAALESAGVQFIAENGGGVGVRLINKIILL